MKESGRILGIDYGSKRVGVSVSDPMGVLSQGVATVRNDAHLFDRLVAIIRDQDVRTIVVGMPYNSEGRKGTKATEVDEFIERLRCVTSVDIETWDESYSSVNAQRVFIESGMKRKKRQQKHRVDEMAARLMLQEYLDQLH